MGVLKSVPDEEEESESPESCNSDEDMDYTSYANPVQDHQKG